jgi:hypothetical protein
MLDVLGEINDTTSIPSDVCYSRCCWEPWPSTKQGQGVRAMADAKQSADPLAENCRVCRRERIAAKIALLLP